MNLFNGTLIYTLLILFSSTFSSQAQNRSVDFIVKLSNDTLYGQIKNQSRNDLSSQITFTEQQSETTQVYTARDLKSYAFADGETFVAHAIDFSGQVKKNELFHYSGHRFLNVMVDGPVRLLVLKDENSQPYFIKEQGQVPQLLCFGSNGEHLYIDVLKEAFSDCPEFIVPEDLQLKEKELYKLLTKYNEKCHQVNKPTVTLDKMKGLHLWVAVGVDVELIFRKIQGQGYSFFTEYALPLPYGAVSLAGGMQHYRGYYKKFNKFRRQRYILRLNYYFKNDSRITPYMFAGGEYYKSGNPNGAEDVNLSPVLIRDEYKWHLGAGIHCRIDQHLVKVECSNSNFPSLNIGYGYRFF